MTRWQPDTTRSRGTNRTLRRRRYHFHPCGFQKRYAVIAYSNDYGLGDDGVAFELNGRYDLFHGIEASATGGYNNAQNALGQDYLYWNAGLTKNFGPLTLDLRYHDGGDAGNLFGDDTSTVNGIVFKISATIGP